MSGAHQAQPPRQSRKNRRTSSAKCRDRAEMSGAHRAQNAPAEPLERTHTKRLPTEPQIRTHAKRKRPEQNRKDWRTSSATTPAEPQMRTRAKRRTSRQPESTCRGVSEFRISPAVPPRAQTPVPALKPAGRSVAPAHNPLSHRAEYRFFASARSGVCGRKARRSYSYAEQETPSWI